MIRIYKQRGIKMYKHRGILENLLKHINVLYESNLTLIVI